MKKKTWDQSRPHTTGTSMAAPDALHLTLSRPWLAPRVRRGGGGSARGREGVLDGADVAPVTHGHNNAFAARHRCIGGELLLSALNRVLLVPDRFSRD